MNNEAQIKFDRCATRLLRIYPFWGSLLLGLEVRQSNNIPTMSTNGVSLVYNPDYVLQQKETIVCTDQAHEVGHKMFNDSKRRKHRDLKLWTIACDYRINLYLKDSGLELGDDFLIDERFRGMDAEEIYNLLQQNPDDPANQQAQEKGGCGCGGLDDHPSQGKPEEQSDDGSEGGEENDDTISETGGSSYIPDVDFGESENLMAIAQALAFAKERGSLPGDLKEAIEAIIDPKIKWEQILQHFMENCDQDDFSWQIPDRRFLYMDMYLPGIESEGISTFVVAVDTSGSTIRQVPRFLGVINEITTRLRFQQMNVLYCDSKIQHADEYNKTDLPIIPATTYGGGGTDFRPVFNWIEEQGIIPKGLVYMTDLDGPFPNNPPPFPVLWVVPKTRITRTVPFGEIVVLE